MRHFLIYTNVNKDVELKTTKKIQDYLQNRGVKVTILEEKGDWKENDRSGAERFASIPEDVDYLLVLGGDGTVLQAARETRKMEIPMIGVNLGTLGYLTEVEPANLFQALDRLLAGEYAIEGRMMLTGSVCSTEGQQEGWALNDIVITRRGILQIVRFDIYVNGQFLTTYNADGVIVTTPTGSTGYNLSAGGPIISPSAKLIMMTPVCSHSLNQRSIVFSPDDVIEIVIPEGREGRVQTVEVNFDGSHTIALRSGDRIRVEQSEKMTKFIQLNQVSFLEVLRKKMAD